MNKVKEFWVHRITRHDGLTTVLTNKEFLEKYCDTDRGWEMLKKIEGSWIPMKVAVPDGYEAVEVRDVELMIRNGRGELECLDDLLILNKHGQPALDIDGKLVALRECLYGPGVDISGKED